MLTALLVDTAGWIKYALTWWQHPEGGYLENGRLRQFSKKPLPTQHVPTFKEALQVLMNQPEETAGWMRSVHTKQRLSQTILNSL